MFAEKLLWKLMPWLNSPCEASQVRAAMAGVLGSSGKRLPDNVVLLVVRLLPKGSHLVAGLSQLVAGIPPLPDLGSDWETEVED